MSDRKSECVVTTRLFLGVIGSTRVRTEITVSGDRLLDIPCKVCDDRSSGKHYGIYSCDGKLKC